MISIANTTKFTVLGTAFPSNHVNSRNAKSSSALRVSSDEELIVALKRMNSIEHRLLEIESSHNQCNEL